jgi:hypothetical protein
MTVTKTHAVELVEKMIADNEIEIASNELTLKGELYVLERRILKIRDAIELGESVSSDWVSGSAHRIEGAITKRETLAVNARSLARVLKAAQPAE